MTAVIIACAYWYRGSLDQSRRVETRRQLFRFKSSLAGWVVLQERIPGPSLADAVDSMRQDKEQFEYVLRVCPLVVAGRDAWGTELVYRVDPDGKRAVIISAGSNRQHEGGKGDDICYEVEIYSSE